MPCRNAGGTEVREDPRFAAPCRAVFLQCKGNCHKQGGGISCIFTSWGCPFWKGLASSPSGPLNLCARPGARGEHSMGRHLRLRRIDPSSTQICHAPWMLMRRLYVARASSHRRRRARIAAPALRSTSTARSRRRTPRAGSAPSRTTTGSTCRSSTSRRRRPTRLGAAVRAVIRRVLVASVMRNVACLFSTSSVQT